MKQGKKPTKKQCQLMESRGLRSKIWLVERDTVSVMVVVSKNGKQKRNIYKF